MRGMLGISLLVAVVAVAGCDGKPPSATTTQTAPDKPLVAVPDVGKVEKVSVTAEGFGPTASQAISDAMRLAILQVNGASIESASLSMKYGLDMDFGVSSASIKGSAFADVMAQRSSGVVQNLRIIDLEEPSMLGGKRYKASIQADIAKFVVPADSSKIKVVIGRVVFDSANVPMGDGAMPADKVASLIRQNISDALVQTGRFAVLDRDVSPEISTEIAMIKTGQAPSSELAKLAQAASADIVWTARVSNMAYRKHVRELKSSNRELVSYSGGWALSHKLVNVATRQVMASESLSGQAPSTEPTTLGSGVDSSKVLNDMSAAMVDHVVASVVRQTFPISVVSRDGTNVVLSQGGQALKENARYSVVALGKEIADPQTGRSLGRVESPCCEVVVDRVTSNLSYGRLENVRATLDSIPDGGLLVRQQLQNVAQAVSPAGVPVAHAASELTGEATKSRAPVMPTRRADRETPGDAVALPGKVDDKW